MDIKELLAAFGEKIGQNLDKSNEMMRQDSELTKKRLLNRNYQPTPEEQEQQKEYYDSMVQAVSGSVAPVKGILAAKTAIQEAPLAKTVAKDLLSKPNMFRNELEEAKAAVKALDDAGMSMYQPEMKKALQRLDKAQSAADRNVSQINNVQQRKEDFAKEIALKKLLGQ